MREILVRHKISGKKYWCLYIPEDNMYRIENQYWSEETFDKFYKVIIPIIYKDSYNKQFYNN